MSARQAAAQSKLHGQTLDITNKPINEDVKDVQNPGTQEEILHPGPEIIQLSYGSVQLFPPTISLKRRIHGFVTRILANAMAKPGGNTSLLAMRLGEELADVEENENTLLNLTVQCFAKPGEMSVERGTKFFQEMKTNINNDDLALLYNHFFKVCGFNKPKNSIPPSEETSQQTS